MVSAGKHKGKGCFCTPNILQGDEETIRDTVLHCPSASFLSHQRLIKGHSTEMYKILSVGNLDRVMSYQLKVDNSPLVMLAEANGILSGKACF